MFCNYLSNFVNLETMHKNTLTNGGVIVLRRYSWSYLHFTEAAIEKQEQSKINILEVHRKFLEGRRSNLQKVTKQTKDNRWSKFLKGLNVASKIRALHYFLHKFK